MTWAPRRAARVGTASQVGFAIYAIWQVARCIGDARPRGGASDERFVDEALSSRDVAAVECKRATRPEPHA